MSSEPELTPEIAAKLFGKRKSETDRGSAEPPGPSDQTTEPDLPSPTEDQQANPNAGLLWALSNADRQKAANHAHLVALLHPSSQDEGAGDE